MASRAPRAPGHLSRSPPQSLSPAESIYLRSGRWGYTPIPLPPQQHSLSLSQTHTLNLEEEGYFR